MPLLCCFTLLLSTVVSSPVHAQSLDVSQEMELLPGGLEFLPFSLAWPEQMVPRMTYTRTFKIGLGTVVSERLGFQSSRPDSPSDIQDAIRGRFLAGGVDLSAGGTKIFYNERTGILMVRASEDDLKLIEAALENLAKPPPLVRIEVKFAECSNDQEQELMQSLNWDRIANGGFVTTPRQVHVTILTELEAERFFKELKNKEGVDLLTMPSITTLSGRQARVALEDDEPIFVPPFHAPRKRSNPEILP
jgi:hypothetical protein